MHSQNFEIEKPLQLQTHSVKDNELLIPYHATIYDDYLFVAGTLLSRDKGKYTAFIGKINIHRLELEKLYVSKTCKSFYSILVHLNTNHIWAIGASRRWNKLCIEVLDVQTLESEKTLSKYFGAGIDLTLDSQGNVYVATYNKLVKFVKYIKDPLKERPQNISETTWFDKDLPPDVTPLSVAYANGFIVLLASETAHRLRIVIYDEKLEEVDSLSLSLPQRGRVFLLGGRLLYDGKKVFVVITEDSGIAIYSIPIADLNNLITIVAHNTIMKVDGYLHRDKQLSEVIRMAIGKEFTEIYVFDGVELRKADAGEKVENILKNNAKTIYVL